MTDDELNRLQDLANAATAGPWRYEDSDDPCVITESGQFVAETSYDQQSTSRGDRDYHADAHFIAASRDAVPALIAEVRRLRFMLHSTTSAYESGAIEPGADAQQRRQDIRRMIDGE